MNIIITGCAGFIGSHATDYFLDKGYNVVGIDCFTYAGHQGNIAHRIKDSNFKLYNMDICSSSQIEEICNLRNISWIINFAAETHVDNSIRSSSSFIRSNIEGVRSLLEVCKKTKARLLHISTDEVYGSTKSGVFSEDDKLDPRNPYSATKAAAEHLITAYNNTHGTEYLIVRPSNNFGPRQHNEKFIPTIVKSLVDNKKVPVYGDGLNIREWLYVKDTARAVEFIMKNSELNQVYNITSKNEMTNISVVSKVCNIMKKNPEEAIEYVEDRPGHDYRYSISSDKLSSLGFDLQTNFDDALKKTVKSLL